MEPIINEMGVYEPESLRRDLACLIALHSCRPGSFAYAYAHADMLHALGIGSVWELPFRFVIRHPIQSALIGWSHRKRKKSERVT